LSIAIQRERTFIYTTIRNKDGLTKEKKSRPAPFEDRYISLPEQENKRQKKYSNPGKKVVTD
jgi:hypothetical protein